MKKPRPGDILIPYRCVVETDPRTGRFYVRANLEETTTQIVTPPRFAQYEDAARFAFVSLRDGIEFPEANKRTRTYVQAA